MKLPNTPSARLFAGLYLDSSKSLVDIQHSLKISRATLYRLIKQSGINSYNVAVLSENDFSSRSLIHWKKIRSGESSRALQHQVELVSEIGKEMNCRLEVQFLPISAIHRKLRTGHIDFSISDMTSLPGWNAHLDFSYPYLQKSHPKGVLFGKHIPSRDLENEMIRVGVVRGSLHEFILKTKYGHSLKSIPHAYLDDLFSSIKEDKIDLILDHPSYINLETQNLKPYANLESYGGFTGVSVAPGRIDIQTFVNQGLEKLEAKSKLAYLERKFSHCAKLNFDM